MIRLPDTIPSTSAPLNSLDQQINSAFRTAKYNSRAQQREISGKPPVDVKNSNLASYVTFPDSEVSEIVPYTTQSVGAPLPSNQGFVDWLCSKTVQEVRKLPGVSFIPKQLLKDLCVLGVNSGIHSIPKLKQFVKSKLTSRRMARLSSKPAVAKASKSAAQIANKMQTVSVSAPVSIAKRMSVRNRPSFAGRSGNVVISHKEFIGNIFSSGTTLNYSANSYVINAGNSGTFPWLSTIASSFDKYKFHKLIIHIVSNQPTSIAGRIGVGIDYDSTDVLPADRGEFFTLTHHQETSPWDSLVFNVPIKPEEKFVNSHTVSDSKLIDCGQIIVMADQIVATSSNLADVIIEYAVELIQPQQAVFTTQYFSGANVASFSAMTITGPTIVKAAFTSSTTVAIYTLPAGYYAITYYARDVGAGNPTCTPAIHGGVGRYTENAPTTGIAVVMKVKVTGSDGAMRFTLGGAVIANLEEIAFTFTRISATAYVNGPAGTGDVPTY